MSTIHAIAIGIHSAIRIRIHIHVAICISGISGSTTSTVIAVQRKEQICKLISGTRSSSGSGW